MSSQSIKNVKFIIKRWDPKKGEFFTSEYTVPVYKGMTVLDAMIYIKENMDKTLTFRGSCRMGTCGICGLVINGKPRLACETQILLLNTDTIYLEPLHNLPLVKDLIVDHIPFFEKQKKIKPYLIRNDMEEYWNPTREYLQTTEEHLRYMQFSYCLTCALCYAACPTTATNPSFIGPQALMNTYRFIADSRDEGKLERMAIINNPDGCWGCHLAGACSEVCPKGVDPALAIQLLRQEIAKSVFGYVEEKEGSKLAHVLQLTEKKITKGPPEFTIEGAEEKLRELGIEPPTKEKKD